MAQPTLATQVLRIGYVTINVSNLERSKAFYENVTPLRAIARTKAPRQAFKALGIEQGEFDGYLMDDRTGGSPTAIHLVEWTTPTPRGTPYREFFHAGLAKIAFYASDPAQVLATLAKHGVPTTNQVIVRGYVSITDPDGTTISFAQNPQQPVPHLLHVMSGPIDLDRTIGFYRDVIGLNYWLKSQAPEPLPASQGIGGDLAQWDSHVFRAWGDHRFNIDVSKIRYPAQIGRPYGDPFNLGIVRVGLEVLDIHAAVAALTRALQQEARGEARFIGPIEEWDFGPETQKRKVAVLQDPDGMWLDIYEPERPFIDRPPTATGYATRAIVAQWPPTGLNI
jgi:catechol 2,3-dioxygenase-like lactoylglutathione lyase family enzyme